MSAAASINELNFPITLRHARERAGLTQRELGEKAGVNFSQISRYEQGLALPRPGMLLKLAAALEVSPEYLRSGEDLVHAELIGEDDQRVPIVFPRSDMELILELAAANGRSFEEELVEMIRNGIRATSQEANGGPHPPKPPSKPKRQRPFELRVDVLPGEETPEPDTGKSKP